MDEALRQRLRALIDSDAPLQSIVEELRRLKDDGFEQDSVSNVLEGLRKKCGTEAKEDRILEVLDYVTGYCAPDQRIWNG